MMVFVVFKAAQNSMHEVHLKLKIDTPSFTVRNVVSKFLARMKENPSLRDSLNENEYTQLVVNAMVAMESHPRSLSLEHRAGDRIGITMDTAVDTTGPAFHPTNIIDSKGVVHSDGMIHVWIDCQDEFDKKFPCNGCGECCHGGTNAYGTPVAPGDWPGRLHGAKKLHDGRYPCTNLFFDTVTGKYRCASHDVKSKICKDYKCSYMMKGCVHRGAELFSTIPGYHLCRDCVSRACPSCRYLVNRAEWFVAFARANDITARPLDIEDGIVIHDTLAAGLRDNPKMFDKARVKAVMKAIRDITGMARAGVVQSSIQIPS